MKRSLSEIRATVLGLGLCLGVSVGCGGGSDGADEADGGGGGVLGGSTSRRGFGRWAVVGIGVGGFPGCGASQRRSRD